MNILHRLCARTPTRTACFAHFPKAFSGSPVGMDVSEAATFKSLSDQWWDRDGDFRALHALNSVRLELVNNLFKDESRKPWYPLYGMKIVDVGCGGGILSEPLARLGAKVLGIDLLPECIDAAKNHVASINPKQWEDAPFGAPEYRSISTQDLATEFPGKFDAVIASELLEHVSDWEKIVRDASVCLKPGGHFIATTINRTMLSYWLGIVVAENVLKIAPRGTHTWDKFIEPSELCMAAVRRK
uniref:Polyprenyldihydroxybenzoate methyltransferase n=1 Tax=Mesocestoides corti TaxID=53468 RepID=A0A5K3EM73_MESCO